VEFYLKFNFSIISENCAETGRRHQQSAEELREASARLG
jgi:hypothetical protein